jgi:hypothetical protein
LVQDVPVTAGQAYEFSFWAHDNDAGGTARVAVRWFEADSTTFISGYYGEYTEDQTWWQFITSGTQMAAPGAAFAHVEIRVYDVAGWPGSATVYVDDASFQEVEIPSAPDTLSIYEIQYNESNAGSGDDCYPSPEEDSTVVVSGLVTASYYDNFWLQDADSAWSGIFVFDSNWSLSRGDSITFRAKVCESYGLTELINCTDSTLHSRGNSLPAPVSITPGDIDMNDGCNVGSEAYEGLLVRLNSVTCIQEADEYGQWYVTDGMNTCQIDDDLYNYQPFLGEQFDYLIGVVDYSSGEYEILPRDEEDLPPRPFIAGISHIPTVAGSDQLVTVMASLWESGDSKAILNDSLFYQVNGTGGAWTAVPSDSVISSCHYYNIPGQGDGDSVFFHIWARNSGGFTGTSPTHKYLVLDEPPFIVINEFLYDTDGDDVGCFIELYGSLDLSLEGFSLVMVNGSDGRDKKVIDLSGHSIPPDGFFVVGQDSTVPNVDLIDSLADFENGPETIHLRKAGFLYDAVAYGYFPPEEFFMGESWPAYDPVYPFGFSLGRYPDGTDTDHNRKDFYVYGSSAHTPGTANPGPTEYTIKDIQQPVAKSDSPHLGELVTVGGVVTVASECTYLNGYTLEMSCGGGWSGIRIYDVANSPQQGDSVQVTGTVGEYYGVTEIGYLSAYSNYGPDSLPPILPVYTAEVAVAESLEGVLVEVHDVTVVDTLDYGEFLIHDGAIADTCYVDDICGYAYQPSPGDHWAIIRGVVDYSFRNFKIQPRYEEDFVLYAPSSLTATLSSGRAKSDTGDVYLEWLVGEEGDDFISDFIVYRSMDPAILGTALDTLTSSETSYTDVQAVGNIGTNYFYTIQARYSGGKPTHSRLAGEFDKYLMNGEEVAK